MFAMPKRRSIAELIASLLELPVQPATTGRRRNRSRANSVASAASVEEIMMTMSTDTASTVGSVGGGGGGTGSEVTTIAQHEHMLFRAIFDRVRSASRSR